MQRFCQLALACTLLAAGMATAQEEPARITAPDTEASDAAMMTTRDAPKPEAKSEHSPFQHAEPNGIAAPAPMTKPPSNGASAVGTYQPKIPFGRGEAASIPQIPSGPHTAESVPVVNVDAVETSEPAPPTPLPPETDPAQENPADPTELTSPIFEEDTNKLAPRKVVLRALNKVTAQSETIHLKPGEKVTFGQIEITAVACQTSSPTSQSDHAALLDIAEKMPAGQALKPLFRGWMYASSPSITALEHPVYDVTMVECAMMPAAKKEDDAATKGKKPAKKGKN